MLIFWQRILLIGVVISVLCSTAVMADCAGVKMESISPLNFGLLRIIKNHTGWAVLDGNGGYVFSNGVVLSKRLQPIPARVKITAPPKSVLMLYTSISVQDVTASAQLKSVTLSVQNTVLSKQDGYWELQMPDSTSSTAEQILLMGGEVSLQSTFERWDMGVQVQLRCQYIDAA
ncbi:hypothetical protein [Plesiomonas sp.]|uniref:hypothetical protein n=1 Tax=Plesiomonas sp. TaxID=2486279 RepID=UPI003F3A7BA2